MITSFQTAGRLFSALVVCALLVGCGSPFGRTVKVTADEQCAGGQLRFIVNTRHYAPSQWLSEHDGPMTHQEWRLFVFSSGESRHQTKRREFLRTTGESYNDMFSLIAGSDLLVHHLVGGVVEQQFLQFDPNTGKDVSEPFPSKPATWVFNRSRASCLTLAGGKAVIFDVLSARSGEPKMTARPEWTQALQRVIRESIRPILTEDTQYLVLLPNLASPSYVSAANFKVEVLSTNGGTKIWSIPLKRNWERFVDAELVDGKILILSRLLLSNGSQDEIKLSDMNGEAVSSARIPATTFYTLWNPSRHEVLCLDERLSPTDFELGVPVWNYELNTVNNIVFHR